MEHAETMTMNINPISGKALDLVKGGIPISGATLEINRGKYPRSGNLVYIALNHGPALMWIYFDETSDFITLVSADKRYSFNHCVVLDQDEMENALIGVVTKVSINFPSSDD